MSTEDLLEHFKLEAEVSSEYTLHVSHRHNRAQGVRERVETKWERSEMIGEGALGQVWRERHYYSDGVQDRAVKIIGKQRLRVCNIDFKKELLALSKFSKPEYQQSEVFVSFLGWFETNQSVFLVMEYLFNGDLAQYIPNINTEDEVKQITSNLLDGLKIMHTEGFAHRDLKPQNIFVVQKPPQSKVWWVKIGDFGISKRVRNEETALRTQTGTPYFQAPEVQGFINAEDENFTYSNSADMWSLGCVVYNISAHKVPFPKSFDLNKFCQNRSQLSLEPLYPTLNEAGIEFIKRLLVPQPAQRMSVESAIEDPWIVNSLPPDPHKPVRAIPQGILEEQSNEVTVIARPIKKPESKRNDEPHNTSKAARISTGEEQLRPTLDVLGNRNLRVPTQQSRALDTLKMRALNLGIEIEKSTSRDNVSDEKSNISEECPEEISMPASEEVTRPSVADSETQVYWQWKRTLKGHKGDVSSVAFSPGGKLIASASDTTIMLWDSATWAVCHMLESPTSLVFSVAFSPDSKLVASGLWDTTIRLWDSVTGVIRHTLEGHTNQVASIAFSPDGKLIASGSSDTTIRLWDSATGAVRYTLEGHTSQVYNVAFSPDGKIIASSSSDTTVRLWGSATGAVLYMLEGHMGPVYSVAFSPDGKIIASSSRDTTVRLWDLAFGGICYTLQGHTSSVYSVAFSPDGKLIASSSSDRTIRLWDSYIKRENASKHRTVLKSFRKLFR